jgi:hypothetical protein
MDIVERLRSRQPYPLDAVGYLINPDGPEAADEIERLQRACFVADVKIERLREVLKRIGDGDQCTVLLVHPTRCKRAYEARAALKETE